jgi:ABC-type multidrug transport system permease subunit
MSSGVKWWTRVCAAVTGAVLTLVVPVHAWAASNGVAQVSVEAARYRRRGGVLGVFGAVCCLVVVGVIALVVYLIVRRRRR